YLSASDLGDGGEQDFILWQEPRIVFAPDESGTPRPPILLRDVQSLAKNIENPTATKTPAEKPIEFGLDPKLFGKHPNGADVSANDLCLKAPHVLEVRLPASLVAGGEFIVTPRLNENPGKEGSAQVRL